MKIFLAVFLLAVLLGFSNAGKAKNAKSYWFSYRNLEIPAIEIFIGQEEDTGSIVVIDLPAKSSVSEFLSDGPVFAISEELDLFFFVPHFDIKSHEHWSYESCSYSVWEASTIRMGSENGYVYSIHAKCTGRVNEFLYLYSPLRGLLSFSVGKAENSDFTGRRFIFTDVFVLDGPGKGFGAK